MSSAGRSLTKLSLAGKNLIITDQYIHFDKHLLQKSPFTGHFLDYYILHCLLWVLSFSGLIQPNIFSMSAIPAISIQPALFIANFSSFFYKW